MTAALCDAWLVNATTNGSMRWIYHALIDEGANAIGVVLDRRCRSRR